MIDVSSLASLMFTVCYSSTCFCLSCVLSLLVPIWFRSPLRDLFSHLLLTLIITPILTSLKGIDFLRSVKGPLSIVAVGGAAKSGKSSLLNLLLNVTHEQGFEGRELVGDWREREGEREREREVSKGEN